MIINPFDMNTVGIEHQGDHTVYKYAQESSDILNRNEIARREGTFDNSKELRKVAEIPFVIWNMWEIAGITSDQNELRKAIQRHKLEYMTTEKQLI